MKRKAFASLAATIVLLLAAVFQLQGTWPTAVLGYPAGQRGPKIDTLRYKVTRSPAAQLIEMTLGPPTGSDMWLGMIRPTDVEAMDDLGYSLSSRSLLHFCEFGFNMRNPPLDDVNFRHALAHLVPKEKIIGTLFKYINIPISTPCPPAQGLWYNPYTDPHPYSQAEAEAILTAAGYQKIGDEWKMPDTSDIPPLRVYVPLEIVSPTSYTVGMMFVDECHDIGLTSLSLEPMDFSTYMDLVFDEWDFDIFWGCWSLGRFPTLLYSFFHSSNLFMGSYNCYGINYPALDTEIETFYYGLDHPAKVAAAKKAQELVMGGTTTDPLAIPAQAGREQAIPLIPVYSKNAYDVMNDDDMGTPDPGDDEGLRGGINMFGYGINNGWTYMNCYWNTPDGYRPGTTDNMVVPVHDEFPETLNPTSGSTVYAWDIMDRTMDGLMATNPYTHRDEPWLATSWSYGIEAGGMYIRFDLRTTDLHGQPIEWQDGVNIAPSDVQFSWDFLADHEISRYWDDMMYYLGADISGNEITAHMSTTSQWLVYALAGNAYLLPPPVWTPWIGQPKNDIESWDPSAEAGPGGLPTKVYGVGPFILQHSTLEFANNGYCDLTANRNYWLETDDIIGIIADMSHSAGDVNRDGRIDLVDLYRIVRAMWTVPGDPFWDPDADICGPGGTPPDSFVGIDDLGTCGQFYGETATVPPDPPPPEPEAPTPIVSIDPPLVIGILPGESFAVDIYITDAEDIYFWQCDLFYDPDVLLITGVTEGDFLMSGGDTIFAKYVDYFYGFAVFGAAGYQDHYGVWGEGILATVWFTVLQEGESPLDLENTKLRDSSFSAIGRTIEDGYYRTYAADVSVYPVTIIGPPPKIDETFTVSINVSDVEDLYTWQAGMTFNETVLEALSIEEGEFLKRAGVPTLWTPGSIDNIAGEIAYSACSLTGPTPGVSGTGQLMNVTFRVKESGISELNLTDVLLLDSNLVEIAPVKVSHGYVEIGVQDIAILSVETTSVITRYLYVDTFTPDFTDWTTVGTNPWLNATDDGNYIEANDYCQIMGAFGFQNITLGPSDEIMNVTLEGYTRADSTAIDMDVYIMSTEEYPSTWLGSLRGNVDWSWKNVQEAYETESVSTLVPPTKTKEGLNNCSVIVHYWTEGGTSEGISAIDALRLKVEIEPAPVAEAYPTWNTPLNISVVVENQGTATETFNVTAYANTTIIEIEPVTLAAGANTTLVFSWNLTGVAEGTYTIRAEASVLYGEIDTADNVFIDGTVNIKSRGDANDDDVLNAYDVGILGQAWGTQVGDPLYDPRADFNGDGVIDSQDHDILKANWP